MGEAFLQPWCANGKSEVVVYVRANTCSGRPVDGARLLPGRRWGSPRLVDGKLFYEYQTLGDAICAFLLKGSKVGRLGRSKSHGHIKVWLANAAEALAERDSDISEDDALDDRKLRALVLKRAAADPKSVLDPDSVFHAHGHRICAGDGTDIEFQIAAEALDLPRWARRESHEEGGPGSGYAQAVVVLQAGHTFADLVNWLHRFARRR